MSVSNYVIDKEVANAVITGLSGEPKSLPSWLLYDSTGNRIFQSIMKMKEYYPTRCEIEIFQQYKELLTSFFTYGDDRFKIVELGAGDGTKTEILLHHLCDSSADFTYHPLDVSAQILDQLSFRLKRKLPRLSVQPVVGIYDDSLRSIENDPQRKVIFFLGANIGNFAPKEASAFVGRMSKLMHNEDLLLIGFDLKKDPRTIQLAYDDPKGITSEFNINVLRRLNTQLGAEFDPGRFTHYPTYDPVSGAAKSFLISLANQTVKFGALSRAFTFKLWEPIFLEISQKYDLPMIERLTSNTDLEIVDVIYDSKQYFCDVLFRKHAA